MSAIKQTLDELMYRSYREQRLQFPQIPPARWVKIFPEWAEYEERFVQDSAIAMILAAEDFAAAGVHTSANSGMDAVGNGADSVESALQDSCGIRAEVGKAGPVAKEGSAQSRRSESQQVCAGLGAEWGIPPAGIISIEMARVQRVMDAHNYAGSGMSKARFDFEVAEGIRLRENEDGGEESED